MTVEAMRARLQGLGVRRRFRPAWEPETGTILLATRKPATIREGRLVGSEIALSQGGVFKVWTPRKQKARLVAARHGLKVRLLDGEAELHVPASLADELLPQFGAKIRRTLSPEQLETAKRHLEQARNSPNFKKFPLKKGGFDARNPDPASQPLPEPETSILHVLEP